MGNSNLLEIMGKLGGKGGGGKGGKATEDRKVGALCRLVMMHVGAPGVW